MEADTENTEMVTIVDEYNQVIGATTRKEMREKKLIHRSTYIFVATSQDKYIIQRRSQYKKWQLYPGYIDLVFGGVVQKEEKYEDNAKRELEEELGVKDTYIEPLFEFKFANECSKLWGKAFYCFYDGEIKKQDEEVECVYKCTIQEIKELIKKGEKITPDSLQAFAQFLKYKKIEY